MGQQHTKRLVLIDGSSYLHRAFHALPPLISSKGEPTGAIYGVVSMVKKMLQDYATEYMAVVFDAKGKNFRHHLYPQYKANRPPMVPELQQQVTLLHEIIHAWGLPLLIISGAEADDIIGTLARQATKKGFSVLISTGDKDLAQLVDKNITLVNTMTNTRLDEAGVKQKFGVAANRIVDYLALVGDSSDNIMGVNGVGPKTAVKWLTEYKSLANIERHAAEIKGKVGENLRASLAQIPLNRTLVTLKDDIALPLTVEDLKPKQPDLSKLVQLFTRLEFKKWLAELTEPSPSNRSHQQRYHTILTQAELTVWIKKLEQAPHFALDLETTSLDPLQAEIVGIALAVTPGEAIYIPVGHTYLGAPSQLPLVTVLAQLQPLLTSATPLKLGQNIKYDLSILANYDIELAGVAYDTMLESYLVNSAVNQHDKESLALRYLGEQVTTYKELVGSGTKPASFAALEVEPATAYAAADAELVLRLHGVLWPQIAATEQQAQVFTTIEMPLVAVLVRMERHGVYVDQKFLQNFSAELATKLATLEEQIYKLAATEFNINSPLQLQEVLYEKLHLPILQKTPKGQPSTAEAVLQELALDYPLPKAILEYRSCTKLKSTYADALPKQINSRTGKIHTSYNQAVTTTGRLSSTNPNLQNIPIRTEEGRRIRKAFVAAPGCSLIAADYSQIELRLMAHLSQDENLNRAFHRAEDVHRATAAEIFGMAPAAVTPTERRHAKTINFGLIYGMSAFGLAKRLGIAREEAQAYINLYFSRYPKVKEYMEQMRALAHNQGYVATIFGRRLYIPEIKARNFARRAAAERAAINAPLQGSAADIIKLAMINIDQWIQTVDFKMAMLLQVHDELVFEVATPQVPKAIAEIKRRMEAVCRLRVPIIVEMGSGANWDETH